MTTQNQTQLYRHLSELEDLNTELTKENSELSKQIAALSSTSKGGGDGGLAAELDDHKDYIAELEGKLDQAEQDLEVGVGGAGSGGIGASTR